MLTFDKGDYLENKLLAASSERISCLQEAKSSLNQCIGEENQGWLQNDKELKILEKTRHCLWKFELWFWTYDWIRLIDPSAPNIVSRPQTPWSKIFLRFHNCIGFISWFFRKWRPVCEKWSYGSGLMAWYVFLAQVTQM